MKTKRKKKQFGKLLALVFVLSVACFYGVRGYLISSADAVIDQMIAEAEQEFGDDEEAKVIALTASFYERFDEDAPGAFLLHKFEPYLSNRRLPSFIKVPSGVIDVYVMRGMCDSAARGLMRGFQRMGLKSVQWDMVTNQYAHSAVMVTLSNEQNVLVDPFHGIIGQNKTTKSLLSPFDVKTALLGGKDIHSHVLKLDSDAHHEFYEDLVNARMGPFGDSLILDAQIPSFDGASFTIGQLDGKSEDVKSAASQLGMTPFWHYAGHRFDRSWIRQLHSEQDVKVTFILTDNAEEGVITSSVRPSIDQNKLSWTLRAGEMISFHDGKAKINWFRLNSYIPVDQILIEKI